MNIHNKTYVLFFKEYFNKNVKKWIKDVNYVKYTLYTDPKETELRVYVNLDDNKQNIDKFCSEVQKNFSKFEFKIVYKN